MAFGDALRPTDGATVVLNVDTSQTAKLERAERDVAESMQTMSRSALKLELANERAVKAMARYGPEAAQTKRALIGLKDAQEATARSADRLTTETRQLNSAQDRQRRGMSSMTKGVLGLAGAYVGVHGLIAGVRTVVSAYREQEVIQGQTRIGVNALGLAYDDHAAKIDRVIRAVSKLGFDDEALYQSFLKLVRGTKDVDVALERMALAAGVARGTFNDLEQGTNIVVKAQLGMSGALRRAGLDVDKNASRTELLTFLTEQFGQSAVKAADDGAVAGERFAVEWENLQEILGSGVSPALADISTRLADYLGDAKNQEEIQRRVNSAVETGEGVVRGFAGALETAKRFAEPLVDALGGVEETVKLITTAWILFKAKAAISFAGTALASRVTATKMIADATAAGRAWDIATRPRVMSVTTVGGGVPVGGTPTGPGPRGGTRPFARGLGVGGTAGMAVLLGLTVFGSTGGDRRGPLTRAAMETAKRGGRIDPEVRAILGELTDHPSRVLDYSQAQLDMIERRLRGLALNRRPGAGNPRVGDRPSERPGVNLTPRDQVGAGSGGDRDRGRPTEADLLLDVARPGNERSDLNALRSFYARQIRVLEGKKNLTKAQKEKLRGLYGDIANVQSQIDAIGEEARAKEEERDRKREERERKAAERERQRMDKILDSAERQAEKRRELFEGIAGRSDSRAGLRALALRGVEGTLKGLKDEDKPLTAKELREELNKLIRDLNSLREFGSNFADGGIGQVATQSYVQTQELREQSRQLGMLVRGQWHPGSWYAGNELAVAGTGVGY